MTARPRTAYLLPVRVRFHECDPFGHVNNAAYLHYLEQAALDHAARAGWPQERLEERFGALFVARRHEIDYLRPAVDGDRLLVVTWPGEMTPATATRRYLIRRADDPAAIEQLINQPDIDALTAGDALVRATTRWAFVRRDTGRPVRIPPEILESFVITEEP